MVIHFFDSVFIRGRLNEQALQAFLGDRPGHVAALAMGYAELGFEMECGAERGAVVLKIHKAAERQRLSACPFPN